MIIIVGYTPTPEGEAALKHGIAEARHHGDELLVVNVSAVDDAASASAGQVAEVQRRLATAGVAHTVRQVTGGADPADEILELERDEGVRGIVIGVRHRTPVGKLLLGSNSQRILLEARSPVIAVKAAR